MKSHTGIIGNDRADRAAQAVAKGEIQEENLTYCLTASNCRNTQYWPNTIHTATKQNPVTKTTDPINIYTPLTTINDHLKSYVHNVCRIGLANQEAEYYTRWQHIRREIEPKYSHMYLKSSKVDQWLTKKVMQYRYGALPTQKLMYRMGKAITQNCLLCNQPDGGHHAVSGCPSLFKAAILRHHDAGAEILSAIAKGERGGEILLSDVGARKRLPEAERPQPTSHCRIPGDQCLPSSIPRDIQQVLHNCESIPDILMYSHEPSSRQPHTFTIVEIKYCRDTDITTQTSRAQAQHEALANNIKMADSNAVVIRHNLMLGVAGSIYKSFASDMEQLGVQGKALKGLLTKLHYQSVKHLGKIWKYRAAMIARQQADAKGHNTRKRKNRQTSGTPAHRKHARRKRQA